jgi:hypothetical protein
VTATQEFKEAQNAKEVCLGCTKCGSTDGLFSHQHGGVYLCSKCFFTEEPGKNWPQPGQSEVKSAKRFSPEIIERATRLGPQRHRPNKEKGFADHNVPFGKIPPKEQEDIRGLMAEIHFAEALGVKLTDEQLTTYKKDSTDYVPGVEVRARSFVPGWTGERDFPVWDKDAKKKLHTYVAYAINRETFEYEIRWLPFEQAWRLRQPVKMGTKGRDMPGVHFHNMCPDLKELHQRVKGMIEDNEILRKQVLAYQKDLALARKILYYVAKHSQSLPDAEHPVERLKKIYAASDRCLKELKQK